MSKKPILVIQLQRLGDIILSFPLLRDLRRHYPSQQLIVIAEPTFYKGLQFGLHDVEFASPDLLSRLKDFSCEAVINLSARIDAAICTAKIKSDLKYGWISTNGEIHALGFWQLYRTALTHNNRHNTFHWSDLNRLDFGLPLTPAGTTIKNNVQGKKLGIFTGASENAKKPDTSFWIDLTKFLLHKGITPILLGGPNEKTIGSQIANACNLQNVNFCGKTSIAQLASLIKEIDLLITPDTGPMHLANWLGIPVLNLSMGNVSAAETGPRTPQQWVLRSHISCAGCWQCLKHKFLCKQAFHPEIVAKLSLHILNSANSRLPKSLETNCLDIFRTGVDNNGLYELIPITETTRQSCRYALEKFWKSAFLYFYDAKQQSQLILKAGNIIKKYPYLAQNMLKTFASILAALSTSFKNNTPLDADFWKNQPYHSRLFAGWLQMKLQNENYSHISRLDVLSNTETLQEIFSSKL